MASVGFCGFTGSLCIHVPAADLPPVGDQNSKRKGEGGRGRRAFLLLPSRGMYRPDCEVTLLQGRRTLTKQAHEADSANVGRNDVWV